MFKYFTKTGKIGFDDSVFARIAIQVARKMPYDVIFTNSKGKPAKIGKNGTEKLNFINITLGEKKKYHKHGSLRYFEVWHKYKPNVSGVF